MMSVKTLSVFRAGRGLQSGIFLVLALVFSISLSAQIPDQLRRDGEETLFAQHAAGPWLETPAAQPEFVLLQRTGVSRIVTLHHRLTAEAAPGTITLFNINGEIKFGPWEVETLTGENGLVYWIVYPDKTVPPGMYRIIDSDAATWANAAATNGEGVVWVFTQKEVSM